MGAAPASRKKQRHANPGSAPAKTPAMLTPWLDGFCVGGASIVLVVAMLALDVRVPARETSLMMILTFLINAPHFMVSYRLLYGSSERRRAYQRVSLYVPAALFAYALFALNVYPDNSVFLEAMFGAASVLLAWHYTGQAFGMMASYGFIQGFYFAPTERKLIRANLYVLLAWHVAWATVIVRKVFDGQEQSYVLPLSADFMHRLYAGITVVALTSSLLGLVGLYLFTKRTGRFPSLRMLLPWVAIHLWYVLLYREPAAIFWVQIAHALQYLVFPLRVEMNRQRRERRSASLLRPTLWYYAGAFVLGVLVMGVLPDTARVLFERAGAGTFPISVAVVAFVNIHHYYIDNVIWKIRNPIVRDELFSHLAPSKGKPAAA